MTKYQKEQIALAISNQLEIITEQFIMASQNKGDIPLIEIDLLKESVRTLYQQINDWQTTNETIATPKQVIEEKTIIVTSPMVEPVAETKPTEVLFNEATTSVEVEAPLMDVKVDIKMEEVVEVEEPTTIVNEVVAETPVTNEGFLSRILKGKTTETKQAEPVAAKTEEVTTMVEPVAKSNEQPIVKPTLQVSRTVYPEPDTTTGNRFKGQETIYDRIRQQNSQTVADRLSSKQVTDLRKSIGINERFTLINELFGGNQQLFMESIDKINNVNAYEEARIMLYEELAGKLKWNTDGNTFHVLDELVKRRFNG